MVWAWRPLYIGGGYVWTLISISISFLLLSQSRTHYLELLYRIVGSTNYKDHRHRQRDLIICLNRIAGEEEPEGHTDRELTKKIWMTYPEVFEEISDL